MNVRSQALLKEEEDGESQEGGQGWRRLAVGVSGGNWELVPLVASNSSSRCNCVTAQQLIGTAALNKASAEAF